MWRCSGSRPSLHSPPRSRVHQDAPPQRIVPVLLPHALVHLHHLAARVVPTPTSCCWKKRSCRRPVVRAAALHALHVAAVPGLGAALAHHRPGCPRRRRYAASPRVNRLEPMLTARFSRCTPRGRPRLVRVADVASPAPPASRAPRDSVAQRVHPEPLALQLARCAPPSSPCPPALPIPEYHCRCVLRLRQVVSAPAAACRAHRSGTTRRAAARRHARPGTPSARTAGPPDRSALSPPGRDSRVRCRRLVIRPAKS